MSPQLEPQRSAIAVPAESRIGDLGWNSGKCLLFIFVVVSLLLTDYLICSNPQRTQYRLYIKARESGQRIPGSSGMNEERIRQLGELGFVWALRGQEGSRRDDNMLQEAENAQNSSIAMAPETVQNSVMGLATENAQNSAIVMAPEDVQNSSIVMAPENRALLMPDVPHDGVMLPDESVTLPHSTIAHSHGGHHTEQPTHDHHTDHLAPNDPEAILESATYNVQQV